jgi:hypothetical protein
MPRDNLSKPQFCEWVPWIRRTDLLRRDGPWLGVYLWGHFRRPPSRSVKPYPDLPRQVIYVGEAKDIDRRPLTGMHHRLAHYRDTFPDDPNLDKLYVSVCFVQHFRRGYSSKKARSLYTRLRVYTQWREATLYWEYTKKWGRPPALHYKKGAYERD